MASVEGYQWTAATGLQQGLPTEAVFSSTASPETVYDVIIIGAGYAGLVAARDLAVQGQKVLVLEARDRIGGRTWTSVIDGFNYEMGGTWVHWKQPHLYAELSRYGMKDQMTPSRDHSSGVNCFSMTFDDNTRDLSHEEEDKLFASALTKFFDVDGQLGREVMPYPHDPFGNSKATSLWDQVSLETRLKQLEGSLTRDEEVIITSMALHMSGGSLQNTGFFDLLRWWALCDYNADGLNEYGLALKLKCGQTQLARRILNDAVESGNCDIVFQSQVTQIKEDASVCTVRTNHGSTQSKTVVCTIPLNVLHEIDFQPPLSSFKLEASRQGHVNMASKIHYEVPGTDLKSFGGMAWPGRGLLYAYGDGTTPKGSTHIVAFGATDTPLHGEDDVEATKQAINPIRNTDVERIVFHNWARDPFAKGAWCMFDTGFASKYQRELQKAHGNVLFASADWAEGWRGFIDGAIEQGVAAAHRISRGSRLKQPESRVNGTSYF